MGIPQFLAHLPLTKYSPAIPPSILVCRISDRNHCHTCQFHTVLLDIASPCPSTALRISTQFLKRFIGDSGIMNGRERPEKHRDHTFSALSYSLCLSHHIHHQAIQHQYATSSYTYYINLCIGANSDTTYIIRCVH